MYSTRERERRGGGGERVDMGERGDGQRRRERERRRQRERAREGVGGWVKDCEREGGRERETDRDRERDRQEGGTHQALPGVWDGTDVHRLLGDGVQEAGLGHCDGTDHVHPPVDAKIGRAHG